MCLAQDDRYEARLGSNRVCHRILPQATTDEDRIRLVADHLHLLWEKGLTIVVTIHILCTSRLHGIIVSGHDMIAILLLLRIHDMNHTSKTEPDLRRTVLCGIRLRSINTTPTVRIDGSNLVLFLDTRVPRSTKLFYEV